MNTCSKLALSQNSLGFSDPRTMGCLTLRGRERPWSINSVVQPAVKLCKALIVHQGRTIKRKTFFFWGG